MRHKMMLLAVPLVLGVGSDSQTIYGRAHYRLTQSRMMRRKNVRKLLVVAGFSLLFAATAVADRINFVFTNGPVPSLSATSAGLSTFTPDGLIQAEDVTKDIVVPLTGGSLSIVTGPVSSPPIIAPPLALFIYSAAGRNSIIIEDASSTILLMGSLENNSTFLTGFPNQQGSFLADILVTFVEPALLAKFGLGPGFQPSGSVSATFLSDNCDVATVSCAGQLSTAGVSIQTPAIPEPTGLGLLGIGLLGVAGGLKRWRAGNRQNQ